MYTAWKASRNAPWPMRGWGKSDFHSRSGLQNTNSTGSLLAMPALNCCSVWDGSWCGGGGGWSAEESVSRYGPPIMPRERTTSRMTWMSSDQLRGSWKTKIAESGMFEKSACYYKFPGDEGTDI